MAIYEAYTNNATISTTEYSLTTNSTTLTSKAEVGIYQCYLDLSALTSTETYKFVVYEKVQSTSTQRPLFSVTFSGAQGMPNWVSPSLILVNGWEMTMQLVSGTARNIAWSIRTVG
jgi:hypothetical protein